MENTTSQPTAEQVAEGTATRSQRTPMTSAEIEARAIARAAEQHVHIFSVPGRPGVYTTCSKSEPGKKYTLVNTGSEQACSCKGFEHRRSCKHVEALRNRLSREAVAQRRQRPANVTDLYDAAG